MIKPASSFSPNFGAIWQNKDINFSTSQTEIVNDIVSQIRTPDKKGKNFEDKHKKWDFYLDGKKNNRVSLTAYHRSKVDKYTGEVFSDFQKLVGVYGKNKKFSIGDIKKVMSDYIGMHVLMGMGALMVLAIAFGNYLIHQPKEENVKPQTEIIQDNNPEPLSNDSIEFHHK